MEDGQDGDPDAGVLAFAIGVSMTVLCIRLKNKSSIRTEGAEGSED